MRDDPRRNLKWLEQQLQGSNPTDPYMDETAELLARVDLALEEEPEPPAFVRKSQKKASINRNIKGLVFLAVLEVIGILAILGWWLQ